MLVSSMLGIICISVESCQAALSGLAASASREVFLQVSGFGPGRTVGNTSSLVVRWAHEVFLQGCSGGTCVQGFQAWP